MILYTEKDKAIWDSKMDNKLNTIESDKQTKFPPTRKEIDKMLDIIMKYIKDTKKKIYGGFAQNKLIEIKNPKDAFYDKDKMPDIDIYSPTPIQDVINICNLLHKAGIKHVSAAEALHVETYKIHAEFIAVLDISYVPANIFNRMPFVEVDGINYVKPWFMMIDMYKMLTDPYHSSFRWEKMFTRIMTVQKNFPFKIVKSALVPYWDNNKRNNDDIKMVLMSIYNFLKNNNSIIVIGHYAYNYFLNESEILKSNNKFYKNYNIPYYQFVSIDYKNDSLKLFNLLKEQNNTLNITLVEHYPLWSLYGYNNYISVNGVLVCHIIHYNKRCTPIKQVIPKIIIDNKIIDDKNNPADKITKNYIQIGSFDYTLLTTMTYSIKGRVIKDDKMELFYNNMTSMLVEIRNFYFKKKNKTMFDDTIFEEYLVTCIGESVDPHREKWLRNKYIRKEKKRRGFNYNPDERYKESDPDYTFANTSGNIINNIKNFRVLNDSYTDKLTDFENIDDIEDVPPSSTSSEST